MANSVINNEEWTELDLPALGWDGAQMHTVNASAQTVGIVIDADRRSPDGRSPWFLLTIDGELMLCTLPQGDTLAKVYSIEGAP